ncbi:hypothetical protein [Haloquadratum walsbyi]|uniref:Uncharacterized protein n=1 Tax=Haloquadratum walsbyi (strain DSM 16854 / JCM 12705 / C23) TaxID=768065 RepID=G0LIF0_HALWC|nr:hypothetical protein [Haloquadratum walsbyi]CCC39870.1 uncharacterized protein Hqrw_1955 [Haloquadratum walsbyi C23]
MSEEKLDPIKQSRGVGIGLALDWLTFDGLSFVVDSVVSGIVLLVAGIIVWWGEYRWELTVGTGVGVGVAGLVALIDVGTDTGFNGFRLVGFIIAPGVADYVLAPAYGKIQDAGEQISNR